MSEDDKTLMDKHGITCETKTIFHLQGHSYARLDDAIKYAKIIGNVEKSEISEKKHWLSTLKNLFSS